jgi:hypothetical protein
VSCLTPLFAFADHGREGAGEPAAGLLRPGNAGSNTAADHIDAARLALAQLPKKYRRNRTARSATVPGPPDSTGTSSKTGQEKFG